ncbi:glycosyltransferase family 4 protein [Rosistilla oblonga]|uniref:glycosyltransferase family 4 protein n=1 Tax=Rosistilla oblonga TaxID=2527990 RepID=UPI003A97F202
MKMLFVAPMPPPMTGNSLPVKVLKEELQADHDIDVINLNKRQHKAAGIASAGRMARIMSVLCQFCLSQRRYDVLYITVAESWLGNVRDIVMLMICRKRLSTVVLHMLGGAGMHDILAKGKGVRFLLNRYLMGRVGAIVVEGDTQRNTFAHVAARSKIHVIPNFAEDYLFCSDVEVNQAFDDTAMVRILFLSNMLYGKGHVELLDAYMSLPAETRANVTLDFAGKLVFETESFRKMIDEDSNVTFHGPVYGAAKRDIYLKSHVFCLPTYYPYEGQPFCILEAYATGCAVVTTDHSGIRNVFQEPGNGFEVTKKSVDDLAAKITHVVENRSGLRKIALNNLEVARAKYTKDAYVESMSSVLQAVAKSLQSEDSSSSRGAEQGGA